VPSANCSVAVTLSLHSIVPDAGERGELVLERLHLGAEDEAA
jgi:hypothetical protein